MRSLVLLLAFAGVLALAQIRVAYVLEVFRGQTKLIVANLSLKGSPSRTRSPAVQWSCDVSEIMTLANDLVSDVSAMVEDVSTDVDSLITAADTCVGDFLSDLDVSTLITCVTDAVQTAITDITTDVEDFINETESTAIQIAEQIEKCL